MFEIKNLDWLEILEKIKLFATSEAGRNQIFEIKPFADPGAALNSFYEIESASALILGGVRPHMESLDLFEIWHSRLQKKAVLKTLELKDIRHFCLESLALTESLHQQSSEWASSCAEQLMNADEPLSAIDQLMTPAGDIRMDASEKLYSLSKEKENLARQIHTHMDKLVRDHKMENMLQEKYVTTREGRWVIPVKGGMQHFVDGVIHGSSHTKQTVFMEPEAVIPMNNRMRQLEGEIELEIDRLLLEVSQYMNGLTKEFEQSKEVLLKCDLLLAKAQLSTLLEARPCRFDEDQIFLKDLTHPLLKMSGKKLVSNSLQLTPSKSILILSGPNAGGKPYF